MAGETNSPEQAKQLNKHGNKRGMHPNSLKNLEKRVSWKPGQPGNPKGLSLTKRREMMLDETCPLDEKGRDWRETLAEDGLIQAHSSPYAMSKLQDRLEGKVPDKALCAPAHSSRL